MVTLKICKWYQTVCLVMTRWLVPTTQRDLPRSNLKVDLSRSLSTISFFMTSDELNIDLAQRKFFTKVVGLSTNYQMPFTICRSDSWFSRSDGEGEKARFRTFQSPPGIGLRSFTGPFHAQWYQKRFLSENAKILWRHCDVIFLRTATTKLSSNIA